MERESDSRDDADPQLDSGDEIDEGEISRDAPDDFIEGKFSKFHIPNC